MTEYVSFYRPGEVTLLLEPTDSKALGVQVVTESLNQLHDQLSGLGIDLHTTQFAGHAGPRPPAVLEYCHDIPHIVHTVNLASWISPQRLEQTNARQRARAGGATPNGALQRAFAAAVNGARLLGARLMGVIRENEQQKALTDVLKVVGKLNDPANADRLSKAPFRLIAATPNWLATPAPDF